jgi:hypothetical protein
MDDVSDRESGNNLAQLRLSGGKMRERGRAGAWCVFLQVILLIAAGCGGHSNPPPNTGIHQNGGAGGHAQGGHGGEAGSCVATGPKKTAGQACACAAECDSNFCADGVCCNQACTSGCLTCNQPGSEGVCIARANGDDPRKTADCAASPASACGLDGKCDGTGTCRMYPAGTMCSQGSCEGAAVVDMGVCDGAGQCRPGPTIICAPFSCDPKTKACFQECSSANDCASGHACDATGSCGKRMQGAACEANSDCLSGFCANNVCCNSACNGPCVACDQPARLGVCWPTDPGVKDPNGLCKDVGAASCGANGRCDGVGGCQLYALGTQCKAANCSSNRLNTAATCDGLGTCRVPGLQDCAPFLCLNAQCTGTCKTNADCSPGIACVNGSCGLKLNGQPCYAGAECQSNQCVDGVCCDSACTGGCRSCALTGSVGKCTMVPSGGADPRTTCKDTGAASCATNGKCDGAGACQLYPKNTSCASESCASNVYTPGSTCDGAGKCVKPASIPCSPYTCNGSKCFSACTADNQCLPPNVCGQVGPNSCGKANNGTTCSSADQCKSGFCAQGVCCDKACNGACQSCALSGTLGTCTNVATGSADPAGMCKDQGATSCGTNGRCQAGACQKYPSGTACGAASCVSGTFTNTSTCDGAGTCVKPAAVACYPYICGTNACAGACMSNSDCQSPATCSNGSCGLKDPGRTCSSGTECKSGFCTQGVCCTTNCNGTCKSCNASAATAGTCTNVAAGGMDPQATCKDTGAASCGTTGVCDGAGACARYPAGTVCMSPSCANSSTQNNARTCDATGKCQAATTTPCAPYACSGIGCNTACSSDADCLAGNHCNANVCGLNHQGQSCNATTDCLSGLTCVDSVCCASPSCGTCQACNVTGSAGTCTNIASGDAAPAGQCAVSTSSPCGNTGRCDGAGGCQKAPTTTSCGTASCTSNTYSGPSNCDGKGACAPPTTMDCTPYICGPGACKTTCTADTDCQAPYTCQGTGTTKNCSKKANGLTCSAGNECLTGNCVDGVCCGSSSCGACQSCSVNGQGTCAPLGAGMTDTRCGAVGSGCGTTNTCDGAGKCQTSTMMCSAASCSSSGLFTPASFCSGTGTTCPVQTPVNCGNYACSTSTGCATSCDPTSGAGCASGSICDSTGHCVSGGAIGQACSASSPCAAGKCIDGVCCNTTGSACPLCQSCNVTGKAGTCTFVGTGNAEPHGMCATSSAAPCGNTGACAADQTCAQVSAGTSCGDPASCTGGVQTSGRTCDGAGTCSPATMKTCDQYICGPTACKTTCASDGDCIAGDYCDGNHSCQPKKGAGATCGSTAECATGEVCSGQGVCCDKACNGKCQSCTVVGSLGLCITDPACNSGTPDASTDAGP